MYRVTYMKDFLGSPMRHTNWFDDDQDANAKEFVSYIEGEGATDIVLSEVEPAKSVSFTGTITGDGECFCWEVSPDEKAEIGDVDEYDSGNVLYPNDIFYRLGCKDGVRYKFIIKVENI